LTAAALAFFDNHLWKGMEGKAKPFYFILEGWYCEARKHHQSMST
jgi:hypothetical protein